MRPTDRGDSKTDDDSSAVAGWVVEDREPKLDRRTRRERGRNEPSIRAVAWHTTNKMSANRGIRTEDIKSIKNDALETQSGFFFIS